MNVPIVWLTQFELRERRIQNHQPLLRREDAINVLKAKAIVSWCDGLGHSKATES
ncbi:MAG: hypothetical protein QGH53_06345 [Prochlorococcaceae cyanobacterium ETNP18_MAG_1]|nr:hypothetical protein [Prochlorococcaceae cyanobacterium ETNP18_MAG_1]